MLEHHIETFTLAISALYLLICVSDLGNNNNNKDVEILTLVTTNARHINQIMGVLKNESKVNDRKD